ncbi:MAG: 30S ribosomal protein S12 methylthiotransferase RimO [Bacteroidales bacterium]|nr:30S ribosomal protein S12 methylthiotransferase RimO [Candidatus Colimorpha pelethequi]
MINIITLGCSKNTVDSEFVAGKLESCGQTIYFDRKQNDCDIVIINTCGFIGDAKEESINVILEQCEVKNRGRKERLLVVCGCLVERYKKELKREMPEVDLWYGVHEWDKMVTAIKRRVKNSVHRTQRNADSSLCRKVSTPKHYAYLKISEGCDRHCSYCAIPLIRGRHISRPIEELVAEAKTLVQNGVKELIVIAQDTTYYGLDLYKRRALGELLERLANESGAEWIRLHYTFPTSFPQDAIDIMRRHDNICNYIDIPLQHISTSILNSMQRGIDKEGTLQLLQQFRKKLPDACIRTTLIVGYPGETEKEFQELKEFVAQARFDRMGVFAYSPEEHTPAEPLGDPVPDEVKQARIDELMALQESISMEINQAKIGKQFKVLIDRREGDYFVGRTEYDSPEIDDEVLIPVADGNLRIGQFYTATITDAVEHDLFAKIQS